MNNSELGGPRTSWIDEILLPHLCIMCFITFLVIYQGNFGFWRFKQKLGLRSDPPPPFLGQKPKFFRKLFLMAPLTDSEGQAKVTRRYTNMWVVGSLQPLSQELLGLAEIWYWWAEREDKLLHYTNSPTQENWAYAWSTRSVFYLEYSCGNTVCLRPIGITYCTGKPLSLMTYLISECQSLYI